MYQRFTGWNVGLRTVLVRFFETRVPVSVTGLHLGTPRPYNQDRGVGAACSVAPQADRPFAVPEPAPRRRRDPWIS